jgi:hypothetical protein
MGESRKEPPTDNPTRTGLERLLTAAARDPALGERVIAARSAAADPAGFDLSPTERAVLDSVAADQLELMIRRTAEALAGETGPRRRSRLLRLALGTAAATTVVLGATPGCNHRPPGGSAPRAAEPAPRAPTLDDQEPVENRENE